MFFQLEYNVDKKKLKEVFRLAGRIIRVDLHTDKDGRSRGFAIVEYDHPVEAVQAISMFHNQVLNDRPMSVRIDRANETLKLPEGLKGIGMGLGTNGEPLRDVARNLPSIVNNSQPSNPGAGILGAVPNQALQMANALSGLNSVVSGSPFGNLSTSSSVLQAANLAGMGGLASNLLNNADLSLASNLVSNPLVQNSSQLAALGGSGGGSGSMGQGLTSNNSNSQSFSRENNSFSSQNSNFNQNPSYSSGRGFQNYDSKGSSGGGFSFGGNNRDGYGSMGGNMGNMGGAGSLLRNQGSSGNMKDGGFSRKVLVTNVSNKRVFDWSR